MRTFVLTCVSFYFATLKLNNSDNCQMDRHSGSNAVGVVASATDPRTANQQSSTSRHFLPFLRREWHLRCCYVINEISHMSFGYQNCTFAYVSKISDLTSWQLDPLATVMHCLRWLQDMTLTRPSPFLLNVQVLITTLPSSLKTMRPSIYPSVIVHFISGLQKTQLFLTFDLWPFNLKTALQLT